MINFKCVHCGQPFEYSDELDRHIHKEHMPPPTDAPEPSSRDKIKGGK